MAILSAYALPHPPLAVPGVGRGQEKEIKKTIEAFAEVSKEIARLKPETIVFITPHNVLYSDYFHISPGESASGDFARFRAAGITLKTRYDTKLAGEIARLAEQSGIPAGFMGEREANLDHGVTVPMWFINSEYDGYMSVRISQSGLDQAEHYKLGQHIAEAAEKLDRKTALIASYDLSHKLKGDGPYGYAPEGPEFDEEVIRLLSVGDFLSLMKMSETFRERAAECGYNSLMVMAGCLDGKQTDARVLSYEGPYGVGYAVASFTPGKPDKNRDFLRQYNECLISAAVKARDSEDCYRALARSSLESRVINGEELPLPDGLPGELYSSKAGVFVSLHKNGRLRGCIGTIAPTTSCVASEIIQNAVSAGLNDNRFAPVTASELPHLTYKVDVLSAPEAISGPEALDVKRYGVIVTSGRRRGLLLPNLEGVDTVDEQIGIARKKAGIQEGAPVTLERFEVIRHE